MKLPEALRINQEAEARSDATDLSAAIVCGFTSLQLHQFLSARLHQRFSCRKVQLAEIPYGDVIQGLRAVPRSTEATFLLLEWQDLDPRLGLRQADWNSKNQGDIEKTVRLRLRQLGESIEDVASHTPVVISFPVLDLPPSLQGAPGSLDPFSAILTASLCEFAVELQGMERVRILRAPGRTAPLAEDVRSNLRFGIPYTMEFQSFVCKRLVELAFPPPPLKGVITDLDNTLWRGIVGDDGPEEVHWNLDQGSHAHAIYQQALQSLHDRGVLLAIASKNSSEIAEAALAREDLRVDSRSFFPREIHWEPKSESVARILNAWNVGADSIVIVDDSAAELAEIKARFTEVNTVHFPTDTPAICVETIRDLMLRFARQNASEEDNIRAHSIKARESILAEREKSDPEEFLRNADSKASISFSLADDDRALELINKTNQFNLNGLRFTEKDWIDARDQDGAFVMTVGYQDKFGPLGKIAVLVGQQRGKCLEISRWVLSCRAFSRRIEHLCLQVLFERLQLDSIRLLYRPTERNKPLQDFLDQFSDSSIDEDSRIEISADCFRDKSPPIYHSTSFAHDSH